MADSNRRWSGLRRTYTVQMAGDDDLVGPFRCNLADVVRLERKYGISYLDAGTVITTEQEMYLAWLAGRRTGQVEDKLFEDWFKKVDDIATEVDEPDPTPPEPSDGSSPD